MKYSNRRRSSNITNKGRGRLGPRPPIFAGGGILVLLLILFLTGDPYTALLGAATLPSHGPGSQVVHEEVDMTAREEALYEYSAVALADTEDAWNEILAGYGIEYREPQMYVFEDYIETGCGIGQTGTGPFYCSIDESIYMDLSFYDTLIRDYGAREGDFILSYVISHEVGHHVQQVTGVMENVNQYRRAASQEVYNRLTVRLELQADYLAGVVARYQHDRGYLQEGDIEDAISTAWAIGDDTIQMGARGYVTPESYTHGTSEQRTRWYMKGFEAGDLSQWDTFSIPYDEL